MTPNWTIMGNDWRPAPRKDCEGFRCCGRGYDVIYERPDSHRAHGTGVAGCLGSSKVWTYPGIMLVRWEVLIWKEQQRQGPSSSGWIKIKEHTLYTASASIPCRELPTNSVPFLLANGKLFALAFKHDGQ
ncbi:hypothetical protein FA13DRAFT_1463887 [Coprinellus micaceus]|uniref:Uncharacterized protein n=1 Tax=Coprinellus micaceus TaxID=71717 RepID=A0A4Y7SMN7_COPMI|nr:hypothetical protein FA13DRAFT_1463887 [Coprinellus micaceus]